MITNKKIFFAFLCFASISLFLFSLSFVFAIQGTSSVTFNTGGVYCSKTNASSSWINATSGAVLAANSQDSCNKYAVPGYISSCCPSDMTCNASANSGAGQCIPSKTYNTCSDYLDSASCNLDDLKLGNKSVGSNVSCGIKGYTILGVYCVNVTQCKCIWDSNRCKALANYTTTCEDNSGGSRGYCMWSSSVIENNCNTTLNNLVLRSKAEWKYGMRNDALARATCLDETRNYPCSNTAKLDFMSSWGYFILVVLIILVYFLIKRRNQARIKRSIKSGNKK
ncbi:hypothetical protein FJZ17_03835 [Candidatus Pacearchaeota archaeon]|nr:hypothetical protein [Candidatus Pacearchaeota archaeon]